MVGEDGDVRVIQTSKLMRLLHGMGAGASGKLSKVVPETQLHGCSKR